MCCKGIAPSLVIFVLYINGKIEKHHNGGESLAGGMRICCVPCCDYLLCKLMTEQFESGIETV